ncbi:MAG: AAA family ATPase [Pseudomonadota bacterium]|nr:AAA family ATPase [Pseudomonadota bacterium]
MNEHTVGQPPQVIQDETLWQQNGAQATQHTGQWGNGGNHTNVAPAPVQPPSTPESLGFFWKDNVGFASSFLDEIERRAQRAQSELFKLGTPISTEEWWNARAAQPAIVEDWFHEDVGVFVAPGGTGKTTLLLFQVIHIVLGRDLFGHRVLNPGPVIILTAEDSRETLIARLRHMCQQLNLTQAEERQVRDEVNITDVSGKGFKLTTVEKDVVAPSKILDRFIVSASEVHPSLIIIDPMVSFGVGESRINDSEQGLIDAARRIKNELRCAVLYVHHTGKANARDASLDQYSGRGGSALADGARMVHVLQRLDHEAWTEAAGDELTDDDSGFVLARAKMTWYAPQPLVYLKRRGYVFERFDAVAVTEGTGAVIDRDAEKVFQFLREEYLQGKKYSQNDLIHMKLVGSQSRLRAAVSRLKSDNRLLDEKLTTGGQGGARQFLRPMELPQ